MGETLMAGRRVPMVNFGAAGSEPAKTPATVTFDAESLLKKIDAMLEDERFEHKTDFLTQIHEWVSERGICTTRQQEAVENVRAFVEDGRESRRYQ